MNSTRSDIIDLQFNHLPGYADFLLSHKMEEFVAQMIANSYAEDIPLLKYFRMMKAEDIFKISLESNTKLLNALKNNTPLEYIEQSRENWVTNQLPIVLRDQVIVEDITLVNYVRKKTFREMLHHYTMDSKKILLIMDEVDRFTLKMDSALFTTYINIQQERLKKTNEVLHKREAELLEAQEIARIGSFDWDLTGNKNSSFTPEVFKIFEMEETSNLDTFLNDVHVDDRLKVRAAIEKSFHDGVYECEYRYNRNGKSKVLYSRGKVIFEKGKPIKMIGTVTDVTDRVKLITKLKENEEVSKQAQALTNIGSWKWVVADDYIEWSDEMYRIYGLEPQSEKITFTRFLSFIHDEDRNRRVAEITEALKTGKVSDYVMKIVTENGSIKILRGKGEVIHDKNKQPIGMLGTCQDITYEYKLTTELKEKNEELIRKNRDLESFNFIANHDLQEPLRKIQLYSNRIINEGLKTIPEHLLKYVSKVLQASKRMQTMIEDFLIFYQSLNTLEKPEAVDLNELIEEIKDEAKQLINNKMATIIVAKLPAIEGSRPHIKQMLKHLISNALKFSKEDQPSEIRINSIREHLSDGKEYHKLSIQDNGIGFDQKYSIRIFELFQRLHSKDEYTGSGIGLTLCKKIAEDHKGWISVVSEIGKGSIFTIYLPCN